MKIALVSAAVLACGIGAYGYAQAPSPMAACGEDEIWLSGTPGPAFTSTGFRIPAMARVDDGVTFCVRGVLVKAQEAAVAKADGQRVFTLTGHVTLTIP